MFHTPSHTAYTSGKELSLEVMYRSHNRAMKIWPSRARGSNLTGVHIMIIFTQPPWQKYNCTSQVLYSIKSSMLHFDLPKGKREKVCLVLFHKGLSALCNLLGCMQVCSARPGCHIEESRGCKLPPEKKSKYLELSANTLLFVAHSSWSSIKGSEQNTRRASVPIQGEVNFTLLEPEHRYLIPRQLGMLPLRSAEKEASQPNSLHFSMRGIHLNSLDQKGSGYLS